MYHRFAMMQHSFNLSERLIRVITRWSVDPKDTVERILSEGVDVNQVHGLCLPLHCACSVGDASSAELLIEHGADVNLIDGYGRSAAHYAAERSLTCLELLVENGADFDTPDANNNRPLHWAAYRNKPKSIRYLLQQGAAVNTPDIHNNTPMNWACIQGSLEAIQVLIDFGADVDLPNCPITRTAYMFATGLSSQRDWEILLLLIRASGQFSIRDPSGKIPQHLLQDSELMSLLEPVCNNARTLKQLCRFTIRKYFRGRDLSRDISELPLPDYLSRYLLLLTNE